MRTVATMVLSVHSPVANRIAPCVAKRILLPEMPIKGQHLHPEAIALSTEMQPVLYKEFRAGPTVAPQHRGEQINIDVGGRKRVRAAYLFIGPADGLRERDTRPTGFY